jgi:crotonobetainyl-CoA:carnitine CoA-transferase CaiB-like acyl-CoA transferase
MNRPFDGVTIIERVGVHAALGERLAVGLAGRVAADLGATVVKIEPPQGDPLRVMPPLLGNTGALFAFLNAGKKSLALTEDDRGVRERLARRSNAVLLDATTGVDGISDIGVDAAIRTMPVTVVVSMLAHGDAVRVPASEFTVMALGGILDIVGDPNREPLRLGGHQAAYSAGLAAFSGLAAALCQPAVQTSGAPEREIVEVSLLETAIWLNWKTIATVATGGRVPKRSGQAGDWPIIRCADGWVALVYQDADFAGLRRLVGNDPRLADPVLATDAGRVGRTAEIAAVVEEHLRAMTRADIHQRSLELRLPLGPVLSLTDLFDNPHVMARDFLRMVSVDGAPAASMPRLPVLWNGKGFAAGDVPAKPSRSGVFA